MELRSIVKAGVAVAAVGCALCVPELRTAAKYTAVGFVATSALLGLSAATVSTVRNPKRLDQAVEMGVVYGAIPAYFALCAAKDFAEKV